MDNEDFDEIISRPDMSEGIATGHQISFTRSHTVVKKQTTRLNVVLIFNMLLIETTAPNFLNIKN